MTQTDLKPNTSATSYDMDTEQGHADLNAALKGVAEDASRWFDATRPEPVHLSEGCFYRDANGQRVGPVYRYSGDTWHAQGSNGVWSGNGKLTGIYGGADLVAPWADPLPAAAPTGAGGDAIEMLPCDVLVAPATIIRKGCPVSTLMLALQQRVGKDDIPRLEGRSIPAPAVNGSESDGAFVERMEGLHADYSADSQYRRLIALARSSLLDTGAGTQGALIVAAKDLLAARSETYRARNNRQVSIQTDDGEKCWFVPDEQIQALELALFSHQTEARDDED